MPEFDAVAAAVEQWFRDSCQGNLISRDTAVYNHMFDAKRDLLARLGQMWAVPAQPSDPEVGDDI